MRRAWASKAEEAVQYWYDAAVERLARAERAEATLNAVREVLARWSLNTLAPQTGRVLDDFRAVLDQHGQTPA